jgi:hypothetical protein
MKISQREARRLKQRVRELEALHAGQRRRWGAENPGGVELGRVNLPRDWFMGRIEAARLLGHAIVITESDNQIHFYAVK